jgi:hypothetical protein
VEGQGLDLVDEGRQCVGCVSAASWREAQHCAASVARSCVAADVTGVLEALEEAGGAAGGQLQLAANWPGVNSPVRARCSMASTSW